MHWGARLALAVRLRPPNHHWQPGKPWKGLTRHIRQGTKQAEATLLLAKPPWPQCSPTHSNGHSNHDYRPATQGPEFMRAAISTMLASLALLACPAVTAA
eukprot:5922679-Alexandrium_andersonii.AAC.1